MSCLFCKIANKEIQSKVVLENDHAISFHDVNPVAPTHVLVIPKKHIASIHEATDADTSLLGELLQMARNVATTLGLQQNGYRLVVNTGKDAGQSVFHIHVHVIAGRTLAWPPG